MKPYVVKQGDHLDKVAFGSGVEAKDVWDHPKNAELKELRGDGQILSPGDILWLPDEPKPELSFTAKKENAFAARVPLVEVSLVLESGGEPLADEPYRVRGLFDDSEQRSDGDGRVKLEVPAYLREVVLELVERDASLAVTVGGLDPVDQPSGARMRLENLGFGSKMSAGSGPDAHPAHDEQVFLASLRTFQLDAGLEPTGELDEATQAKLLEKHGS